MESAYLQLLRLASGVVAVALIDIQPACPARHNSEPCLSARPQQFIERR
jgi:hypothetical protein